MPHMINSYEDTFPSQMLEELKSGGSSTASGIDGKAAEEGKTG